MFPKSLERDKRISKRRDFYHDIDYEPQKKQRRLQGEDYSDNDSSSSDSDVNLFDLAASLSRTKRKKRRSQVKMASQDTTLSTTAHPGLSQVSLSQTGGPGAIAQIPGFSSSEEDVVIMSGSDNEEEESVGYVPSHKKDASATDTSSSDAEGDGDFEDDFLNGWNDEAKANIPPE